ncbi:hypothetical protein GCM10011519_19030 [Marmoricola endophyticus]|uniref:DUF5667 domain-containing protein n=1 Tax=Marmoricola endophyticus TaxID=2040280 RepID=A0A917F3H4_9ACTN|nr:DUF5667 domain-containing protein [Marmoricola endophyticus]GGF45330.1 hypothetical protein GCM10011519_19030 [Marmoricola endophyticus]
MIDFSGPAALRARPAERFARLIDEGAGATGPADAALIDLVGALRALPEAPAPSASYTADLRERLMAEADTALVPAEPQLLLPEVSRSGRARRRATVAAAAAVLVGSTGGLAVAAQGTVEGDPLYGVKRGIEAMTTSMSLSEASRGQDYLDQSRTRLAEVSTLMADDPDVSSRTADAVRSTLARFASSAAEGSDLLFTSYQRDASADHVASVRSFAGTSMRDLDAVAAEAPPSMQDALSEAATMLTDLDQQARVLCAACGAREPLALTTTLEPASAKGALDRLIESGTAGARPASPAPGAKRSQPATSPSGSTTAPGSSRSPAPASTTAPGTAAQKQAGKAAGRARGTTSSAPALDGLVKLPGSQSGAPSVIDLDKLTKDLTDGLTTTTKGLTDGLAKGLNGSRTTP